jgi:thymidylate synthase (FAD)
MKVNLIGYMQVSPEIWAALEGVDNDPELIASVCMHGCRTIKDFLAIAKESDEETIKKRVQAAIKMKHFTVAGFTDWIFEIRGVSRALTHQLVRHRTAWFLQQSQRAVNPTLIFIEEEPDGDEWYVIPPKIAEVKYRKMMFKGMMKILKSWYHWLIEREVPKEDARLVLPNATKSNIYMKIDGSNLMHLLKLRLDRHAQWEIRELANRMYELVKAEAPNLFAEELQEYWW